MLSVLMPAYNAAAHLGAAIDSVLNQTVHDFELLIIDDGSNDGTFDIASDRARLDNRIRVVRQQNAGIAETLNRGLRELRTEWVFLMHADDVMMPNRLERQSAFITQHSHLAAASSLVHYINERGDTIGRGLSPFIDPLAVAAAAERGELIAFNHPACVLKRSAILGVGGYRQKFWPAEDCDLWARLVHAGHTVLVQPEYLLKYRIHASSASVSRARLMQQKTLWLEECIRARRNGDGEPSWEEFQSMRRGGPWNERFRQARQEFGRTFYQMAVQHASARSYVRMIPTLVAAAALQPTLIASRLLGRVRAHRGAHA